MTTKNLLYNRWFSDQIEPHRCGIKTHPQPFGKCAKNVEKVEDQSQLLDEYLEGNGRLQELENCAHHNSRNGRNSRVGRPRSCKSCDFFHSLGFDGSHFSNSSFWNLLLPPTCSLRSSLWSSTFWSILFSLSKRCVGSLLRQWDSNRSKNHRLYRRFFVVLFPFIVLF